MALSRRDQTIYWGVAAVVFLILLYTLGSVILPFLVGGAVAYFLDPVADRLERLGLSRALATTVIAVLAVLVVVALVLAVIPTLVNQTTQMVSAAPDYVKRAQEGLLQRFPDLADSTSVVRQSLAGIGETVKSKGLELANSVIGSAMGALNMVLFLFIVPVVAFYMLLDWDRMVARVDALLPRDHAPVIRHLAREIDKVLAGFVRGQLTVCLIVGAFYSIALALAGLQFGLVVGAIAGAITFIPYVGSIVGGALAIGLALMQFWGDWWSIGLIAAIFALGQFLEGNIITPRLVGNSVGLHPVWLLFALSAFGTLFGFAGMLVAVPVAASIGVLVRFASGQYTGSMLYRGQETLGDTVGYRHMPGPAVAAPAKGDSAADQPADPAP